MTFSLCTDRIMCYGYNFFLNCCVKCDGQGLFLLLLLTVRGESTFLPFAIAAQCDITKDTQTDLSNHNMTVSL